MAQKTTKKKTVAKKAPAKKATRAKAAPKAVKTVKATKAPKRNVSAENCKAFWCGLVITFFAALIFAVFAYGIGKMLK